MGVKSGQQTIFAGKVRGKTIHGVTTKAGWKAFRDLERFLKSRMGCKSVSAGDVISSALLGMDATRKAIAASQAAYAARKAVR
tara:strand:+ start:95 stop:343 length:249 start_codon:yes stop_codon:yes gene_type:complete